MSDSVITGTPAATGLTLVLGPANSGKLGRALDWWQARQALHPLIAVPTGPDARSLSVEMAQRLGALIGQSPAVTFDGLVHELIGRSPRYAGHLERSLLIAHLLHEHPPQAPGFSARFPGTVGVTASLLEQLGDSGRGPDEIECVLERWASADAGSAALAADIGRLLTGYLALRDGLGLCDRSDTVREALAAAGGWGRPLALYGFTSFTMAQRRLVAALAEVTEVLLVFDYERSRERSLTTRSEFAFWEGRAARIEEMGQGPPAYTSRTIAYLERHFLDDGPTGPPPPSEDGHSGVRFLLASGRRNEAELAAEQVAVLMRGGLRPGEIAVVVRSMEPWGKLLDDVFASCDIPCQVDQRLTLHTTGLGHAFLTGLRGFAGDDPAAVLAFLRSPYSALTLEQAGDVELAYLRGAARGVAALARRAENLVPGATAGLAAAVDLGGGGSFIRLGGAQDLARHMLANSFATTAADPRGAAEDARAYRGLQSGLDDLAGHLKTGALPGGALRVGILLPALAGVAIPAGLTGSPDAVQVLTAHRARARRFQAVLILGLVEGEFPGRATKASLLTSAQRAHLDRLGGELFAPEADLEEALFVRAVSRAWKVLMLSARDSDDGGGYTGQSYYWAHCKDLLGAGSLSHAHRTLADQVYEPAVAPSPRHYMRTCSAHDLKPHPSAEPVDGEVTTVPAVWTRPGAPAALTSPAVLDELAATGHFSPSVLETYLRCPFTWFIERVVGTEDMETLVDNRLVGELLHAVLRDTFRRLGSEGMLPVRPEYLAKAEHIAGGIITTLVRGDDCPGSQAERRLTEWRLRRLASDLLAMEAAAAGRMLPTETEIAVGGAQGVDIGGLAVRGRIDRVDRSPQDELFIVDYKSGSAPKKNKIGTADGLQLPLYMMALAAERPDCSVIGGAYVSPGDKELAGVLAAGSEDLLGSGSRGCRVAGEEELGEILQGALDLAKQAAEGIRGGDIAPLPERECPAWCRLGPVCRARRGGKRW